jgi:hypothetical protein
MQQVAASSEEQSASTQQIAAAAAALSHAAENLSQLVANLRLDSGPGSASNPPSNAAQEPERERQKVVLRLPKPVTA